ncbi:thiamine pyrophosphate-dependent enzyme [Pseudonocardia sp. KRD291]|uniref:thiamine pyrophosphate-dependent enzyme n=1 Tax=Pseudonocardia sp. KRD291 TaxID=2792007 RepID=UPI001C4A5D0A|nr:thiamine pyrophosphate-dependent enzyme [Pseudonocardia sp. KRD291]MBW0104102.1 acetolactate synthase [Pseudonocardia sp. KRD291]
MTSAARTVSTVLADTLSAWGVNYVFGVPSESATHFLDALHEPERPEFVAARHEGGAAFMAEAHAAASGTVGVVLAGRAVGAANLSIGVHTARENSTPMLVIVGQMSSRHQGREGFQETDLPAFLGPVAKAAHEEADPQRVPEAVHRALVLASRGRPGPVVLSLPEEVFGVATTEPLREPVRPSRPRPSADDVAGVLAELAAAERPVIIAGAGVLRSGAEERLREFAVRTGVPVLAAWRRHDVFPNDHPLYAGHLQMGTHPEIVRTLSGADLVLAVGSRLGEITVQNYTAITDQRVVAIDIDPAMLGKSHPVVLGVAADAEAALTDLVRAAPDRAVPEKRAAWATERRAAYEEATAVPAAEHTDRVDSRQIIRLLRAGLPDDAVITNDAGNFAGWLHTFFRFVAPNTYVGAASGAMGYALPAAIGARLARPDRPVVAVAGDGGTMMTFQELETAVRLGAPVVLVVMNNNMFGSIRMHQERAHPGRVVGSELGNPDFAALAQAFGAAGETVRRDTEFGPALAKALMREGPTVIEVVTDPEQISVSSTITELRERAR